MQLYNQRTLFKPDRQELDIRKLNSNHINQSIQSILRFLKIQDMANGKWQHLGNLERLKEQKRYQMTNFTKEMMKILLRVAQNMNVMIRQDFEKVF
jgi:hypothetical protein